MITVHTEDSSDGQLLVTLTGELDADNADALLERVSATHQAPAGLVMQIEGLHFIDSSGLSAFLKLRTTTAEGGGSFAVVSPTSAVHRVFEIAGLLEVFGLS